jgi:stage II sporulation protein D
LARAERELRGIERRTGWRAAEPIELRIYPDLDSFRNATGEPGWVAARSGRRRIELQPVVALESRGALDETLRHELLHVWMESQAADVPVWFREGLVGYLERPGGSIGAGDPIRIPSDADLRQRTDAARARQAYAEAARAVRALAVRYGDVEVFSWLNRGLPPALKNAREIQAVTKSR